MKYLFVILLLIPLFVSAQSPFDKFIFYDYGAAADSLVAIDSIASITSKDSVYIEMGYGTGVWKLLSESVNDTAMITGDDKVAEGTVIFNLSGESWWTHIQDCRFRILSTGVDTLYSAYIDLPDDGLGAYTLDVVADTSGTATYYYKSHIHGN